MQEKNRQVIGPLLVCSGFFLSSLLLRELIEHYPSTWAGDGLSQALLRSVLLLLAGAGLLFWYQRQFGVPDIWASLRLAPEYKGGLVWGGVFCLAIILPVQMYLIVMGVDPTPPYKIPLALWLDPVIVSPFIEEVVFRGLVFWQLAVRFPVWSAALVTSVLFAGFHLPTLLVSGLNDVKGVAGMLLLLFTLSMVLCLAFRCTRSLWTPILGHSGYNLAVVMTSHV